MRFDEADLEAIAEKIAPVVESTVDARVKSILEGTRYPEIMSSSQAAEYLGVDVQTIRRQALAGKLPSLKIGRSYRFRKQDLLSAFDSTSTENFPGNPSMTKGQPGMN